MFGAIFNNKWMTKLFGLLLPSIKTKIQLKYMNGSIGSGLIAQLQFNSLEVGKWYRASFRGYKDGAGAASSIGKLEARHNSLVIGETNIYGGWAGGSSASVIFKAEASILEFFFNSFSSGNMIGNGTKAQTYVAVEILKNYEETTDLT